MTLSIKRRVVKDNGQIGGIFVQFILQKIVRGQQTPNPSIEGMRKRLRLLCTPHVKR